MAKSEIDFLSFDGIGNASDGHNTLPIQVLPTKKKSKAWKKVCMDRLERIGIEQLHENIRFREFKKMKEGEFTYSAVGLEEMSLPWFSKEITKLRDKANIPTYLKHFDFIGIVTGALEGIYSDFEDVFRIDSIDEYSTNEYIRQKTEMLHQYARQVFKQEVNKLLLMRGIDPNKQDFQSEEEAQAYQQQIQQEVQALTPAEIEQNLSKNFKVIATEWAQNTLNADNKRFRIPEMDRENFVEFLLSGRYFKHFFVGYDYYRVEPWKVEEVFFSQDADAEFPQDGEYAGRITNMAPSKILDRFGHLLTTAQQEGIGNYWNQSKNINDFDSPMAEVDSSKSIQEQAFPTPTVVPFHNYFDHMANKQLENAFGAPLGKTTIEDEEGNEVSFASWMPEMADGDDTFRGDLYSSYLRDDINVRRDTLRVTEAYWRSYKRMAVLIIPNDIGSLTVELVTDDLIGEYLTEEEIKKLRNISLQDLQMAMKEDRLDEYANTITYIYVPEVWKGIKIKGNGSTVKKDIYVDVRPLDYQIKGGDSNLYDVKLPVAGIISTGLVKKLIPYQQLHNIAMNQITELLEKELGVFFAFDLTGLGSEYQDETTEEAIYRVRDIIKDTGIVGFDLSRQNTQGNQPNLFQRHEVVFATQVQYRWTLAQQYKQEALAQIGITPQVLGQPNTYTTAEGVKQGMQSSYALINPIFDKMNLAKAKEMEIHIAVAQYCQSTGKDQTVLYSKGDSEHRFLDIMAEDGELFPLRHLGVIPISSSKDRKILEQAKQIILNDNTLNKSFSDALEILTSPTLIEMKNVAANIEKRTQQQTQEQRQFEAEQVDKQIAAAKDQQEDKQLHETLIESIKADAAIERQEIASIAAASIKGENTDKVYDLIQKSAQDDLNNSYRELEIGIKNAEVMRKTNTDTSKLNIELMKLQQKAAELKLDREKLQSAERIALYNKN